MPLQYFPDHFEKELVAKTISLSRQLIPPTIRKDDETSRYPKEIFQAMAKEGVVGQLLPKTYGGKEASFESYYACIDQLAQESVSLAIVVGVTNLVMGGILKFGSEAQKANYLPKLAKGEWLGAFSLSEPSAGSDAGSLILPAKKTKDGYRLNGTKCWCSNAGHADIYLVMTRTSDDKKRGVTSFLVEKDTPGFRVGKQEKKLGLKTSTLAELIFEDCLIPESQRLGEEGQGFEVALSQLEAGRIGIAACGLGAATRSLELLFRAQIKNVSDDLAEYYARLIALKSLMHTTTVLRSQGKSKAVLASSLKLLATDLAMELSSFAVENLSLDLCDARVEAERIFRDSKALQIVEGTNQIQKLVLSREMEKP